MNHTLNIAMSLEDIFSSFFFSDNNVFVNKKMYNV